MKFKNKHVLDVKKRYKRIIIVGGILLTVSIVLLIFIYYLSSINYGLEFKNMRDVIENEDNEMVDNAYIEASWLSSQFAFENNKNGAYHYAFDGKYYYIVYLDEEKANELLNTNLNNNPVKITGMTWEIPDDIKEIAIEDYNNSIEDGKEKLTKENFYKVFGEIYLLETSDIFVPYDYDYYRNIAIVIAILVLCAGAFAIFVGIMVLISFLSRMKKISDADVKILDSEMSNSDSKYYDKVHVYLTPNYLITTDEKFLYYKYSDILWMYDHNYNINAFLLIKSIQILTKDAKTSIFANTLFLTKNQKSVYDEIWNTIASKNPDIMLGYTNENITYFKDVVKEIKRKKKN